jgi:hypothetical protein
MRASIFLATFLVALVLARTGVLPGRGASGVFELLIIAGLVSAPISYVALSKQRDAMSEQISTGLDRRKADKGTMRGRIAAQNAAEDALDDAVRAER